MFVLCIEYVGFKRALRSAVGTIGTSVPCGSTDSNTRPDRRSSLLCPSSTPPSPQLSRFGHPERATPHTLLNPPPHPLSQYYSPPPICRRPYRPLPAPALTISATKDVASTGWEPLSAPLCGVLSLRGPAAPVRRPQKLALLCVSVAIVFNDPILPSFHVSLLFRSASRPRPPFPSQEN